MFGFLVPIERRFVGGLVEQVPPPLLVKKARPLFTLRNQPP